MPLQISRYTFPSKIGNGIEEQYGLRRVFFIIPEKNIPAQIEGCVSVLSQIIIDTSSRIPERIDSTADAVLLLSNAAKSIESTGKRPRRKTVSCPTRPIR